MSQEPRERVVDLRTAPGPAPVVTTGTAPDRLEVVRSRLEVVTHPPRPAAGSPTPLLAPGARRRSWAGTQAWTPAVVAHPRDEADVARVVVLARERGLRVRAVGSGHSSTPVAVTDGVQLDLGALRGLVAVDLGTRRARVRAGTTLRELSRLLAPHGLALENLGDVDTQTLAGAVCTGTHGTGVAFGGLAAQVVGARLVLADGTVLAVGDSPGAAPAAGGDLLDAVTVGLGALGVLTELTVRCVPAFLLRSVERPEPMAGALEDLPALLGSADHVDLYWWPGTDVVMTKRSTRLPGGTPHRRPGWLRDRVDGDLVENGGLAVLCEVGHRVPRAVPALSRLATRVSGHRERTDTSHRVLTTPRRVRFTETEVAVPLAAVGDVVRELRALLVRRGEPVGFPVEVRAGAAEPAWLSPAHARATGWVSVQRFHRDDHGPLVRDVDAMVRAHGGRPHWGKLHHHGAADLAALYPRFADVVDLRDRLDPDRTFGSDHLDVVLGR